MPEQLISGRLFNRLLSESAENVCFERIEQTRQVLM
jgi:hypothetical protein